MFESDKNNLLENKEAWVIGTNFLRGFYTIFDMD
jgi:hypothetical protein